MVGEVDATFHVQKMIDILKINNATQKGTVIIVEMGTPVLVLIFVHSFIRVMVDIEEIDLYRITYAEYSLMLMEYCSPRTLSTTTLVPKTNIHFFSVPGCVISTIG